MAVITNIRRNVHNAQRCSIFIDDTFYVACHIDVVTSLSLRKGVDLTPEIERQLRKYDTLITIKQKIYAFCIYKPRTRSQAINKLELLGADEATVNAMLVWLEEFHVIDDVAYVTNFVSAVLQRKPMSALAIKAKLRSKGISEDIIDSALATMTSDEDHVASAIAIASRKMRTMKMDVGAEERRQTLIRVLQNRGFAWPTIKKAIETMLMIAALVVCTGKTYSQKSVPCERKILSDAVNKYQPTTLPVQSPDGTRLYVDRKLHPQNSGGASDADDIWVTMFQNGRHIDPVREPLVVPSISTPDVLFNFTSDGLHVLVVGSYSTHDSLPRFAILSRKSTRTLFDSVTVIGIDTLGANYYGFLVNDRRTMLAALVRPNGLGELDLYAVDICNPSQPAFSALGPVVNTNGIEGSPWLASDNRTLYFTSSGHKDRRGKSDIYRTQRLDKSWTSWSPPSNLGPCFNTIDDETSISLSKTQDTAFITSWSPESGRQALFSIKLDASQKPGVYATVSMNIVDAQTNKNLHSASVMVMDTLACGYSVSVDTVTGIAQLPLSQHSYVTIVTSAPGYVSTSQKLGIRKLDSVITYKQTVRLLSTQRPLLSLYFDKGSSELTELQRKSIDSLITISDVRDVSLLVQGYTDVVGSVSLNRSLSLQRAETVKSTLLQLGLDPQKLVAEGKGIERMAMQDPGGENPTSRRVDIFVR